VKTISAHTAKVKGEVIAGLTFARR